MTTAKAKSTKYEFNLNAFSWIGDLEAGDGWQDLSLVEVQEYIDEVVEMYDAETVEEITDPWNALLSFMGDLEGERIGEVADTVLTTNATNGTTTTLMGPSVFRDGEDDEQVVLKIGGNLYRATIEGDTLAVGPFSGRLSISKVKDNSGDQLFTDKDRPILELKAVIKKKGEKGGNLYEIPLALDLDGCPSFDDITGMLVDGDAIQNFLKTPSSGGAFIDMRLLPVGEYLLEGVIFGRPHEEYGNSYRLRLAGIKEDVMAKGKNLTDALGGNTATADKGQWKFVDAAAKKKGGITLKISTHTVKVGDNEHSFKEWATTPALFNSDEKQQHFIKAGFFTRRKPNPESLASMDTCLAMIARGMPGDDLKTLGASDSTQAALPESDQAVTATAEVVTEEEQAALAGVY